MVAHLYAFSAMIILIIHTMLLKILLRVKYFLTTLLKVHFLPIASAIKALLIRIYNRITLPPANTKGILTGREKTCGQPSIKREIFISFLMKPMDNITYTLS